MSMMGPPLTPGTEGYEQPEEEQEEGPEDGHTFRVVFDVKPSFSVGDGDHRDADDFTTGQTFVEVRAWNLKDALLKAAELPLKEWIE